VIMPAMVRVVEAKTDILWLALFYIKSRRSTLYKL